MDATIVARPPDSPRRCFICLTDQSAGEPDSIWVDPCPCTLEAHQDCMLSWVTDCERSNKPLQCPVCKYNISMEGPWDPLLKLDDLVRRKFSKASPYVLCTALFVGVQFSLQMYGAMAMAVFAGKDNMFQYLLGAMDMERSRFGRQRMQSLVVLTNVAPTLLFSQLLPGLSNKFFLPTASLYGLYHVLHDDSFLTWPPTPQLALTIFPCIRSVYYNLWKELVMPYEVKLNRQILGLPPIENGQNNRREDNRRNPERNAEGLIGLLQGLLDALEPEDDDGEARNIADHVHIIEEDVHIEQHGANGEVMVEVVIEEIQDDDDEDQAEQNDEVAQLIQEDDEHNVWEDLPDGDGGEQGEQRQDLGPQPEQPPQDENQHEVPQAPPAQRQGLGSFLSNVSNNVVGALLLPGISFVVGEALRLALPKTWTNARVMARPGLLQQQWGRSLVGGCVYVVIKDVLRVYAKQRKVTAMEYRKVKNVDRRRERV